MTKRIISNLSCPVLIHCDDLRAIFAEVEQERHAKEIALKQLEQMTKERDEALRNINPILRGARLLGTITYDHEAETVEFEEAALTQKPAQESSDGK